MRLLHKTTLSLLTVFFLFASTTAFAQQSDFQIKQDFRAELSELTERIITAVSSDELRELEAEIDQLEARYAEHSEMISGALYPETFDGKMGILSDTYASTLEDVELIEQLNERIDELAAEMEVFRERLSEMNLEMSSLEDQLERAEASEARQAALIRQYRQNIEQRDNFVSEFLEELLSKYRTMDRDTEQEITEATERLDDNPLEIIQTIIIEYIEMTDHSTALETPDYVAMRAQHGYFDEVWDKIGEQLVNTFAPDNPVTAREEVEDLIGAWLASIDNKLWDALSTSFNQNGIELDPFTSPDDFYAALNAFVDAAYEISLERNDEEDHQIFRNFSDFWNNTVKASWGDLLIEGNVLSQSQIASIDLKMNDWSEASAPTSNLMFILLLISIAVIIGLIILIVMMRSKP